MNRVLIVGYGNTLRGDDGIGPHVVESLAPAQLPPGTRCLCLPQLDISLVAQLPQADVAIFVDARHDDDAALIRVDWIGPPELPDNTHSSHSVGLPFLIGLTEQCYGRSPCCYLIQPKGVEFSICETLSEAAYDAAKLAGQSILQIVWAHCGKV